MTTPKPTAVQRHGVWRGIDRGMGGVVAAAIFAILAGCCSSAFAANGTWTGGTSGTWGTATNWSGSVIPGATAGTTNADTATFNANATNTTLTVDANRNIQSLLFTTATTGTFAYTIGSLGANAGETLLLSSGGSISITGTINGNQTINAPLSIQSANGSYTFSNSSSGTGLLLINGNVSAAVAGASILNLAGTQTGSNTASGTISNGSATTLSVSKSGAGQWVLTGNNTYTGSTSVTAGTLTLGGANGSILSTSSITVSQGATLRLDNSTSSNTNRVSDSLGIALNGGSLTFSVNTATGSFSETLGALNLGGGLSTVTTGQAVSGGTSTLTFASLSRPAGAGINFVGTGLGSDSRNQVLFTSAPTVTNGIIGPWATYGGSDYATYGANGVAAASYTDINALGSTIADSGTANVRLSAAGSGGNIALGATTTSINTLLQNTNTAATVDTASKTLRVAGIMVGGGTKNTLRIGVTSGDGTVTALTSGGELVLNGNNTSALTVNAVIADNGSASSVTKIGGNTVILNAANTYTGTTTVAQGTLQLGSGSTTGSITGPVAIYTGATLASSRTDASSPVAGGIIGLGGGITVNSGTLTVRPVAGSNSFGTLTLGNNTRLVVNGDAASTNGFTGYTPGTGSRLEFAGGNNTAPGSWFQSSGKDNQAWYFTGGTTSLGSNNAISYSSIYGYALVAEGGRWNTSQTGVGWGANSIGVLDVTGTLGLAGGGGGSAIYFGAASGAIGVFNQSKGSVFTTNAGVVSVGNAAGGRGELNISGGTFGSAGGSSGNNAYNLTITSNATATGLVNLTGGSLYIRSVNTASNPSGAYLNFDGGTLVANQNITWANTNGQITVYDGGATLDDGGFALTVSQAIAAPTGYGVTALPTISPTAGYVGSPYVFISGGSGTNAAGVADYDPVTGNVTGIRLTNPGTGYQAGDSVNVWLRTVSGSTSVGNATLGQNVSGGLTKLGSGTLALTGANTYTGTTSINAGTLQIGNNGAVGSISPSSQITGSAGATLAFYRTDDYGGNFTNTIGGAIGVTLRTGTLVLAGANTYTGTTTASGGTLLLGHANALGTSKLVATAAFTLGASTPLTGPSKVANNMDFPAAFTYVFTGSNAMELSGTLANTLGSTYQFDNTGTTTLSGALLLTTTTAATVTITGAGPIVISGSIGETSGFSGLLQYSGSGGLTLSGTNGFTNNFNVLKSATVSSPSFVNAFAGVSSTIGIRLGRNNNADAGSGALRYTGTGETFSKDISLGVVASATSGTTAFLEQAGTGLLRLSGKVGPYSSGSGSGYLLVLQGSTSGTGEISGNVNTLTSATFGVSKRGSGTWILSSAASTYNGQLTIEEGTLQSGTINNVSANGPLGNSASAVLMGRNGTLGTFAYSGSSSLSTTKPFTLVTGGSGGFNVLTATTTLTLSGSIDGAGGFVKLGSGTLALNAANTYAGAMTAGAGVVRFDTLAAGSGAQNLGSGSVVNLGVAAASAGELNYFGAGGTLDKNVFALGTGRNRVRNSGGGTLTLSGTLTKNGTILELAGGAFNVTGQITGGLANSDLYVNGASVTLTNSTNDYNGPTYVYGGGSLTLGASNVVPSGSALLLGGTGSDTGTGSIAIGTFTDTVASLTSSSLGGTVSITGSGATMGGLTTTSNLTFGAGTDTLALSLTSLSLSRYSLITYQGTRSGTFDTVTGLTDSRYALVYGGTNNGSIDLQYRAGQATTFTLTPAATRVLVGGSTTLAGSLVNSSPGGAAALAWSPTVSGSLTGVSSSLGSSITAGGTSTITATFLAGNTAGSQAWSIVNTDNSAITTTSTASGSISVVNQRAFTTSTPTLAFGNVHQGGSLGSPTLVVTSTGSYATTASASLGSFTGGPSGFSLGLTNGSAEFSGGSASQSATFTLAGSTASPGAISGTFSSAVTGEFNGIPNVSVAVTGSVYSGQSVWATNGGGNWGTLSGTGVNAFGSNWGANQGSPGLDAAFANVDSATFGSAFTTGGTATINTNGANISLKSLAFDNATGSYSINQTGGSGPLTLLAAGTSTAAISVLAGSHTIHADVSLGSSTVIDVVTGAALTFHNAVSGSAAFGLTKIGGGALYFNGGSDYAGNTDIREGMVSLLSGVNPLGTGIVTVYSGATLDLNHLSLSNTLNVLSGGILLNTGTAQTVSVDDAVIFSGTTNGTVDVGSGGNATFQSAVAGAVTVDSGGMATFTSSSPLTGSLTVSSGGMAVFNGSNTAGSTFNVASGGLTTVGLGATIGGQLHVSGSAVIAGSVAADADVIVQAGGLVKLVEGASFAQTSLANAGAFVIDRSSAIELATAISGSGSLVVNGGRVNLSGINTYSGLTEVTGAGSLLAVNGQVAGDVQVGTGAELGGSGLIVGTIGGDGLIAPGNSPGILTVQGQVDPTTTTSFAFEFMKTGDPIWSSGTGSMNDVLRLTNADPFVNSLTNSNVVNVYFEVSSLTNGDIFRGGFFSDSTSTALNFATEIGSPTYAYYVLGTGSGSHAYNGKNYYTLSDYLAANSGSGITGVTASVTTVKSATFSDGTVTNGQVTQFVIIPEPDTIIFAGIGIAMAGWTLWKRRRIAQMLRK